MYSKLKLWFLTLTDADTLESYNDETCGHAVQNKLGAKLMSLL